MQFWDCKITLSFSNQKIKDRSETLINKGIYEVELKFIASLIIMDSKLLHVTSFICTKLFFYYYLMGLSPVVQVVFKNKQ